MIMSWSVVLGGFRYLSKALLLLVALVSFAQAWAAEWPPSSWTQAVQPFRIAGPVYYVGSRDLSAYFIHGSTCSILVNVGLAENAEPVLRNIETLGFSNDDVQHLLILSLIHI